MKLAVLLKKTATVALVAVLIVGSVPPAFSQSPAAGDTSPGGDPWPRRASANGATISIYQPQLESWNGNLLDAYAAVTIKTSGTAETNYGVIWFTARTEVDKVNRVVSLSDFTLTKHNFPTLPNNGLAYTSAFQR